MGCQILHVCIGRCISEGNAIRFLLESETVVYKNQVFKNQDTLDDDEFFDR